jgi:hypothetical protein
MPNPLHSAAVTYLLVLCAEWHALAKLRMHTDSMLQLLQAMTVSLGEEFRSFVNGVCKEVPTKERKSEKQAREEAQKRCERKQGEKPTTRKGATFDGSSSSAGSIQVREHLIDRAVGNQTTVGCHPIIGGAISRGPGPHRGSMCVGCYTIRPHVGRQWSSEGAEESSRERAKHGRGWGGRG